MPRKDRRFTAEDLLRFYCSNLTPERRALIDAVGMGCEGAEDSPEDMLRAVFEALTSPPLSTVIGRLPGGGYISDVITLILMILDNRVEVSEVEWVRINDAVIDTTRPTLPLVPRWLLPR